MGTNNPVRAIAGRSNGEEVDIAYHSSAQRASKLQREYEGFTRVAVARHREAQDREDFRLYVVAHLAKHVLTHDFKDQDLRLLGALAPFLPISHEFCALDQRVNPVLPKRVLQ